MKGLIKIIRWVLTKNQTPKELYKDHDGRRTTAALHLAVCLVEDTKELCLCTGRIKSGIIFSLDNKRITMPPGFIVYAWKPITKESNEDFEKSFQELKERKEDKE